MKPSTFFSNLNPEVFDEESRNFLLSQLVNDENLDVLEGDIAMEDLQEFITENFPEAITAETAAEKIAAKIEEKFPGAKEHVIVATMPKVETPKVETKADYNKLIKGYELLASMYPEKKEYYTKLISGIKLLI